MTEDIVERLRAVEGIVFTFLGQKGEEDPSLCHEAADEIERLRAEVAKFAAAEGRE